MPSSRGWSWGDGIFGGLGLQPQNWNKPLHGKTFGEITLEDFATFDKAGLAHPDLSRMKQALGDLGSNAPSQ